MARASGIRFPHDIGRWAASGLTGLAATVAIATSAWGGTPRPEPRLIPVGAPIDCIRIANINSTQVRDDRTIDFIVGVNTVYRNTLPHSCPRLGSERSFSYATSQPQLCSVDIVHVLTSYGGGLQQGAGCGLGKFQRMEKPRD